MVLEINSTCTSYFVIYDLRTKNADIGRRERFGLIGLLKNDTEVFLELAYF
jgi:hypothetical protein